MIIFPAALFSQDIDPAQYRQNPLLLNPAYAGSWKALRLASDLRGDFIRQKNDPDTRDNNLSAAFSADIYFDKIKSGFGVNYYSNEMALNTASVTGTRTGLDYAFHLPLCKDSSGNAKMWLQAGVEYAHQVLNYHFDFKYAQDYNDLSAGILLFSKNFYLGFSARHINEPHNNILVSTRVPFGCTADMGFKIKLSERLPDFFIQEHGLLVYDGISTNVFAGVDINYNKVYVGAAYGTFYEAAVYSVGFRLHAVQSGYSYERGFYGNSRLYMPGSHELYVRFHIFQKKTKLLLNNSGFIY